MSERLIPYVGAHDGYVPPLRMIPLIDSIHALQEKGLTLRQIAERLKRPLEQVHHAQLLWLSRGGA